MSNRIEVAQFLFLHLTDANARVNGFKNRKKKKQNTKFLLQIVIVQM